MLMVEGCCAHALHPILASPLSPFPHNSQYVLNKASFFVGGGQVEQAECSEGSHSSFQEKQIEDFVCSGLFMLRNS